MTKVVSNLPSHWQLKYLVDVYYRETFDNEYGRVLIDGDIKFTKTLNLHVPHITDLCT